MKEFILTTRLKQNALVVYISKNLPKKCLSRLISPPVSILIQYFQLRNICVCFIKHQQPFLVQFNSNLQAFATLCLSTNWTIYSIKSFVFPFYQVTRPYEKIFRNKKNFKLYLSEIALRKVITAIHTIA